MADPQSYLNDPNFATWLKMQMGGQVSPDDVQGADRSPAGHIGQTGTPAMMSMVDPSPDAQPAAPTAPQPGGTPAQAQGALPDSQRLFKSDLQKRVHDSYTQTKDPMMVNGNQMDVLQDRGYDPSVYKNLSAGQQLTQQRVDDYNNAPARPNLMGLMALADAWGTDKSNLAGDYSKVMPPTAEQLLEKKAKLQDMVQKENYGLTQAQAAMIRSQFPGNGFQMQTTKDTTTQQTGGTDKGPNAMYQKPGSNGVYAGVIKDYRDQTKKLSDEASTIKNAYGILATSDTNPAAGAQLARIMSKVVGERASELSARGLGNIPGIENTLESIANKADGQSLTPVQKKALQDSLDAYAQVVQDGHKDAAERIAQTAPDRSVGATVDGARSVLMSQVPHLYTPKKSLMQEYMELKAKQGQQ